MIRGPRWEHNKCQKSIITLTCNVVQFIQIDIELEQGLRAIYYNHKTGYQSAERLYQKALEDGLSVSREQVKDWLRSQDTYTRYKPIVRRYKFRQTKVNYLGKQIQMDLVDMGLYKNKNKDYYWILTYIKIAAIDFPGGKHRHNIKMRAQLMIFMWRGIMREIKHKVFKTTLLMFRCGRATSSE